MSHPNEDLVRGGYLAFQTGDIAGLRSTYLTEDIIWHEPGNNPNSGDYRGIDEVLAHFMHVFEETGGSMQLTLHDVLANDTHAVVLGHVKAERKGKTADQDYVHVFHIRDGKAAESWIHNTDQAADDEFWN